MHAVALVAAFALLGADVPASEPVASTKEPSTLGRVGVALLAGGAALAATTAAGASLLEAVTTPDDNRNKPQHPEVTEVAGFVTVAVGSLAAGLVIAGGAIVLEDAVSQPAQSTSPSPSPNAAPSPPTTH